MVFIVQDEVHWYDSYIDLCLYVAAYVENVWFIVINMFNEHGRPIT